MGFINSKVFIITAILVCFYTVSNADDFTASMRNFVKPHYNEKTHLLEHVLTGTNAKKTEGAVIEITNARIELIGEDGKTVRAVLTTPVAFYNQTTQFITGDQAIKFESLSFDADGIGFDASQIAETLHIRKNVKLVIKSTKDIKSQFALGKGLSEDTGMVSDTDTKSDTTGVK